MYVAKTKALISFAVTAKLICVFVLTYAKCCFSHGPAQFIIYSFLLNLTWPASSYRMCHGYTDCSFSYNDLKSNSFYLYSYVYMPICDILFQLHFGDNVNIPHACDTF